MEARVTQLERARTRSSFRALIAGAASLLDIFATRARPKRRRTPEDDARNLHGDAEKIGRDFSRVLSSIRTASEK